MVRIRRLHPDFGAEVLGVDPLAGIPSAHDLAALRRAFDEHQLLLFRCEAPMSPQRQVEITGWFGPPVDNVGDGRLWTSMDNANEEGRRRLPFHSDFTYTDCPIKGLSLHALELPPSGTTTSFVSAVHAWATLEPDRQDVLAHLTVRHRRTHPVTDEWPEFVADHPIRFVHPRTGQPLLFVTEHNAFGILGLEPAESEGLLRESFAHMYAPERVYLHHWQLYDLVIWDNLAVQHAREAAELSDGHRLLQRVALNEVTYGELVARAWEQQNSRQTRG